MEIKKKYKQWWAEEDELTGHRHYHGEPPLIKVLLFSPVLILEKIIEKPIIIYAATIPLYIATATLLDLPPKGWLYLGLIIAMLYMMLFIAALACATNETTKILE